MQETPERDGALSESPPTGGNEIPPEVTVGEGNAPVEENATRVREDGEGIPPQEGEVKYLANTRCLDFDQQTDGSDGSVFWFKKHSMRCQRLACGHWEGGQ